VAEHQHLRLLPRAGLAGGIKYTVMPNPNLKSTDGGPLTEAQRGPSPPLCQS